MNKEKNLSYLVLIRHGQSEWNEKNLFTGWKNPPLTEKGIEEAKLAGKRIKKLNIDLNLRWSQTDQFQYPHQLKFHFQL